MGFSRILAEFAENIWLAENPPEKNTASRKSAEKVGQPAEYNKKIRLVGLPADTVRVGYSQSVCVMTTAAHDCKAERK